MSDLDLKAILDFTVALAYDAGKLIIEGSEAILQPASVVDTKKNTVDLVTEYDVRVEELVKERLGEKYPSFQLYVYFLPERVYSCTLTFLTVLARNLMRRVPDQNGRTNRRGVLTPLVNIQTFWLLSSH